MKTFLMFIGAVVCAPFVLLLAIVLLLWGHHCWHELGRTYAPDAFGYGQAIGLMVAGFMLGMGVIAAFLLALAFKPVRDWWLSFLSSFRQPPQAPADPDADLLRLAAEMPASKPQILALAQQRLQLRFEKGGAPCTSLCPLSPRNGTSSLRSSPA